LFIGRFQPGLHLGQIDGLKQAMEKGVRHFLIGIGSSNKEFTRDNPFTYDERKTMIELSLKACLSGRQGIK
jgi:nicotinamide mononucleotide adenylyltransferase